VSPGGIITAGGGPTDYSVTIKWISTGVRTVSINYTNNYGCTAATAMIKNVTVNPLPSPTITGPASVTVNTTSQYNTATGMTNYIWSVSPGGTIISGGGSGDSWVNILWSVTGAQYVSVNYSSLYGCSAATPTIFNVTVNPPVLSPGTGPGPVIKEIEITNGLDTTSNRAEIADISIYPVPNDGRFTIAVTSRKAENYSITIYNYLGTKVYDLKNLEINGSYKRDIDLGTVAEGIYMVMIRTAESQAVRRIFIKK
jgi:hypothetical protein